MQIGHRLTQVDDEMRAAVQQALDEPMVYAGPTNERFEEELAGYFQTAYGCTSNSGTTAYWLILAALGIGPGDAVILPANAYVTVPEVIIHLGATPVLCDVRYDTANLDVELVRPLITERTKAIVPIHTYGLPVDMDPLAELAAERSLHLVEDCAHAMGAEYRGRRVGSLGTAGFVSFAAKSMTVCGPGGAAVTDDPDLHNRMYELKRHGWRREADGRVSKTEIVQIGYNFQLSELHASLGRVQLKRLDGWNGIRAAHAAEYTERLQELHGDVAPLAVPPDVQHGWLHYAVLCRDRDRLRTYLEEHGIEANVLYEHPMHLEAPYQKKFKTGPGDFPVTERLCREILVLPSHPWLEDGAVAHVSERIKEFYRGT